MKIESSSFGTTKDGSQVTAYTVTNHQGAYITVIDYGAVLQSIGMPDAEGKIIDVALGYDNVASYEVNPPHFGATIGRNGNRIEEGAFVVAVGGNRGVPEGMLVREVIRDDIINKPGACGYSAHNDHREKDDPEECRSYFFQVRQEYRKK